MDKNSGIINRRGSKVLIPLFLLLILAGVYGVRKKPFHLNRTLRETSLRMIQISVLSRTTGLEHRVEFREHGYAVQMKDPETKNWRTESEYLFDRQIQCRPAGLRCYFVRGRFVGYDINGRKGPRYILLDFTYPARSLKRSLIFFRRGDWRAVK